MELKQLKNKQILSQLRKMKQERKVFLKPSIHYKNVLLLSKTKHAIPEDLLKKTFPSAQFMSLSIKTLKKDEVTPSGELYISYADFNYLGKLKNENLKAQLKNQFDLVIDLSDSDPILMMCIFVSEPSFIIGKLNAKYPIHDLAVDGSESHRLFIENIRKQIDLLTQKQ